MTQQNVGPGGGQGVPPGASPGVSKIRHSAPGFGQGAAMPPGHQPPPLPPPPPSPATDTGPVPVADTAGPALGNKAIRSFERERKHEESWTRTPNTTGSGAIHVRTFHSKLTEDALIYMDQTINEWLDAHPQYEVKFVTATIGTFTGKIKEPALICQVWV